MTAATAYARSDEARAVAAIMRFAARQELEQRAAPVSDLDEEDVIGLLIAAEHGISGDQVAAYRSLGRSRGLALDEVLRAHFRGELREVVELPKVGRRAPAT